jgi:hypothetical protein
VLNLALTHKKWITVYMLEKSKFMLRSLLQRGRFEERPVPLGCSDRAALTGLL